MISVIRLQPGFRRERGSSALLDFNRAAAIHAEINECSGYRGRTAAIGLSGDPGLVVANCCVTDTRR